MARYAQAIDGAGLLASSLPANPFDGMEFYYLADATGGVVWHLRYRAGSSSAYKWEYVGGGWLYSEVQTDEGTGTTASATYASLATAGPSITVPLAGDYWVEHGAEIYGNTFVASWAASMSYAIGATAAVAADEAVFKMVVSTGNATFSTASVARARLKAALAASTALVAKYKADVNANDAHFLNRWMRVIPRRVG